MIQKSIVDYYYFGTELRYLADAKEGLPLEGDGYILQNIARFLENLDELGLMVTKRAASKLRQVFQDLEKSEGERLSREQASELGSVMRTLKHTVDAEMAGMFAFITTSKRLDIERLLDNIAELFAPGVFSEFSDIARLDFMDAGRCIAFELPTAAAFHTLRATEANLRHYYMRMVRQQRVKSQMWGPIVQDLQKRRRSRKYATLNNHLDNIRLSFRNPTQHPEKVYDIQEAQDLMALSIDANNRMFKILEKECPSE
jgi:hypothetical protein